MSKNIILCFDGTWNKPEQDHIDGDKSTNVWHFYKQLKRTPEQIKWYDQGVGSTWFDKIHGGLFGSGLSENIRQGYAFLAKNYQPGDKVFLIGFSRGAYTARSLGGMLYKTGLTKDMRKLKSQAAEIFKVYQSKDVQAQTQLKNSPHMQTCPIEMIGVFDTVGALGIPVSLLDGINNMTCSFHDCTLNDEVKHAYHLVAVDEERENFSPTLWDEKNSRCKHIEQVWFSGVHSDIGGGYAEKGLSNITLKFLIEKSQKHGLMFKDEAIRSYKENILEPVHDSYAWWFGPRKARKIPDSTMVHATFVEKICKDRAYQERVAKKINED